jgi:hypothetical protein
VRRRILEKVLQEKVKASMADDRPSVPANDVFRRLRAHHRRRLKAEAVSPSKRDRKERQ